MGSVTPNDRVSTYVMFVFPPLVELSAQIPNIVQSHNNDTHDESNYVTRVLPLMNNTYMFTYLLSISRYVNIFMFRGYESQLDNYSFISH